MSPLELLFSDLSLCGFAFDKPDNTSKFFDLLGVPFVHGFVGVDLCLHTFKIKVSAPHFI